MMPSTGKYVLGIIGLMLLLASFYRSIYLLKGNNLWRFGWLGDSTYREVCEIIVKVQASSICLKKIEM